MVEEGIVSGWDDPRMPTISGLRRRGYTPNSIRHLLKKLVLQNVKMSLMCRLLEFCIREDLNKTATGLWLF